MLRRIIYFCLLGCIGVWNTWAVTIDDYFLINLAIADDGGVVLSYQLDEIHLNVHGYIVEFRIVISDGTIIRVPALVHYHDRDTVYHPKEHTLYDAMPVALLEERTFSLEFESLSFFYNGLQQFPLYLPALSIEVSSEMEPFLRITPHQEYAQYTQFYMECYIRDDQWQIMTTLVIGQRGEHLDDTHMIVAETTPYDFYITNPDQKHTILAYLQTGDAYYPEVSILMVHEYVIVEGEKISY
ncbi:hypothetical protein PVA45_05335 [Entomospira entomophila]|uniref:Uncharacterized protein n=1 Tax=Entomospira entomophila TaxID=2719988 RepID=A0A968KT03_9SPIO|nr:hypothetical protein [Entomospira entomophilus]NIZ40922.1 hypothetical protein [Entomospira entomophilus]WDI35135.1 hypothetical protein PVA45_05335 [Entomospira entomophilus]